MYFIFRQELWTNTACFTYSGPNEFKNTKRPLSEMISHDTMKEILGQALRDKESAATNIVSTIQPSRVDGFLNGLNVLLDGRGGYYQV